MGVMTDYFAAASDERAATVLDLTAGPGGAMPAQPGLMAALQAGDVDTYRQLTAPRVRWSEHGFQVLDAKGIDPIVMLGTLESLLTGADYDDVVEGPRAADIIADTDDGFQMVVTVTDELQQALAQRSQDDLAPVAAAWAQTEEFGPDASDDQVEALVRFLGALAELARDALGRGERLYCWVCV